MSAHDHLTNQYRPSIGDTLTYPVSSTMPNVEGWNTINTEGPLNPRDKVMWAESEDYNAYMAAFVEKYGHYEKPFSRATMMVLPSAWKTGYNESASLALTTLAELQGEAKKIKDSIGVVNNSIQRLEGLLYDVQQTLSTKNNLRENRAYADLADREAPEELATLDSDIEALKGLNLAYSNQLAQLRADGITLNQELDAILTEYKTTANSLNINDNFEKEMRAAVRKASNSSGTKGLLAGGISGFMGAAALVFVISQMRRSPQRVRSNTRGSDGLFFRAP